MIVRTITVFDNITVTNYKEKLKKASIFLEEKETLLKSKGISLQTKRVATSLFDSMREELRPNEYVNFVKEVNDYCKEVGITFFNAGTLEFDKHINIIENLDEILKTATTFNASLKVSDNLQDLTMERSLKAAKVFKKLVETDYHTTFRFSINGNCPELIPFYPVSFYKGTESKYAVGIQLATEVNELLDDSLEFDAIFDDLFSKLNPRVQELENLIVNKNDNYEYAGIDTSFAPMVSREDSIGNVYERILKKEIGSIGTLAVTERFTRIMKTLDVKKTGYCGIMLAVLEDSVLAKRYSEGHLDLQKLMFYSTVCACGLDTIPVSSEVSLDDIAKIYYEITLLSFKHNKPLTARLMSNPNSKPGEMTKFDSPYITNTKLVI